ncbi:universal stress protein [Streptomyces sp. MUM 178J]|uniref:universal stress protein n=1 Tax=Streptomyces sp. MUM 178J TaxID=2791991 RepID=UPI001F042EAC|nr:universal stress protein [Streptomyces sp. MUM 178J]WRQ78149.1 universal stress protein [Streptomyces sp. MUM 178J]
MAQPLVVGVDGSGPSLDALDWAVDEAILHRAPLRIVHASSRERFEGRQPSFDVRRGAGRTLTENIAAVALERARQRAGDISKTEVTSEIAGEEAADALVRRSRDALAVVVGSRGRGELAGLLLGSTGLWVAAHAESPVFVVRGERPRDADRAGDGVVTVGVGAPEEAAAALDFALSEAELRGTAVRVVHAWQTPSLDLADHPEFADAETGRRRAAEETRLEDALTSAGRRRPGVVLERSTVEGHARDALLRAAADAALLVVGARRRGGHVGMQLGPVNHAVLHHADCAVALVPHR